MAEAPGWSRSPPLGGGKERGEEGEREGGSHYFQFLPPLLSNNPGWGGFSPSCILIEDISKESQVSRDDKMCEGKCFQSDISG